MKAVNIKWDINYDETASLPTEVDIPENLTDPGAICEWLTEKYGYCHDGFKIEMTEEERKNYCKTCKRSIYSEYPSCDMNIEDNGYYNHANYPCYTRVEE